MSLGKDKCQESLADATQLFKSYIPSSLYSHRGACCRIAREWFVSLDLSMLTDGNLLSGPKWIRDRFDWGYSKWPLYWCKASHAEALDCGALAGVAREVLTARGLVTVPVQLVQVFSEQNTRQWASKWSRHQQTVNWMIGDLVYHEACAIVLPENRIQIWDPTDNWWISPDQLLGGYASTIAVRVRTNQTTSNSFIWGTHQIRMGEWEIISNSLATWRGDPEPLQQTVRVARREQCPAARRVNRNLLRRSGEGSRRETAQRSLRAGRGRGSRIGRGSGEGNWRF